MFIFVEHSINSEFSTYSINKESSSIKYMFADDVRVYEFIESVYELPRNNPITPFQTASDIVEFPRNQWAGLFQRFLQDQKRLQEMRALEEMKSMTATLERLTRFLTEERKDRDNAIQQILLANHPAFRSFRELTNTPYRIFFSDEGELNDWLKARKWLPVPTEAYDDGSYREWHNADAGRYIRLTEQIFDDEGRVRVYTEDTWNDGWLQSHAFGSVD